MYYDNQWTHCWLHFKIIIFPLVCLLDVMERYRKCGERKKQRAGRSLTMDVSAEDAFSSCAFNSNHSAIRSLYGLFLLKTFQTSLIS